MVGTLRTVTRHSSSSSCCYTTMVEVKREGKGKVKREKNGVSKKAEERKVKGRNGA